VFPDIKFHTYVLLARMGRRYNLFFASFDKGQSSKLNMKATLDRSKH